MKHPSAELKTPYYFFSTNGSNEEKVLYEVSNEQDKDNCGKHLVTYLTKERFVKAGQSYLDFHGNRVQVTEDGTYPVKSDYINIDECTKTFPYIVVGYQESLEDYIVISDSDSKYKKNGSVSIDIDGNTETYYRWTFGGNSVFTKGRKPDPTQDTILYNENGVELKSVTLKKFVTAESTKNEQYLWLDYLIQDDDTFNGDIENNVNEIDDYNSYWKEEDNKVVTISANDYNNLTDEEKEEYNPIRKITPALGYFVFNKEHHTDIIFDEDAKPTYCDYYAEMVKQNLAQLLLSIDYEEAIKNFPEYLFAKENEKIDLDSVGSVYFNYLKLSKGGGEESAQRTEYITKNEIEKYYKELCCELIYNYAQKLTKRIDAEEPTDILDCLNDRYYEEGDSYPCILDTNNDNVITSADITTIYEALLNSTSNQTTNEYGCYFTWEDWIHREDNNDQQQSPSQGDDENPLGLWTDAQKEEMIAMLEWMIGVFEKGENRPGLYSYLNDTLANQEVDELDEATLKDILNGAQNIINVKPASEYYSLTLNIGEGGTATVAYADTDHSNIVHDMTHIGKGRRLNIYATPGINYAFDHMEITSGEDITAVSRTPYTFVIEDDTIVDVVFREDSGGGFQPHQEPGTNPDDVIVNPTDPSNGTEPEINEP